MKTILLIALFFVIPTAALGQAYQAICNFPFKLTGSQTSASASNKAGCVDFYFTYAGTNPVVLEASTDGVTWDTASFSVVSGGSFPTTPGRGAIRINGYAPLFRFRGTGTGSQTTAGQMNGAQGVTGVVPGSEWMYPPGNKYTPLVPSAWTSVNLKGTRTDTTFGAILHKSLGTDASEWQSFCRPYPAAPFTAKMTVWQPDGAYWSNDAGHYVGISIRNSGTGLSVQNFIRNRQYWALFKCNDFTLNCPAGPVENEAVTIAFQATPITMYLSDDGINRTWAVWDFMGQRRIDFKNSPIQDATNNYVTPDQLCFTTAKTNGNYPVYTAFLGYDVSSP